MKSIDRSLRFNARRTYYGQTVELFASQRQEDEGKLAIVMPVNLELKIFDMAIGELPGPMLSLEKEDAQRLLDALFDAGFRPSGETDKESQLGAVLKHLADMRALVNYHTGIALP